jgi:RNA polymerase sigma factor (sigma-70 family)
MARGTGGTATLIATPLGERDDRALVAAVRRGEDAAFEVLYERYLRRIVAFVHGMVYDRGRAEDVTQEVFMSALRRMRETERPIAFRPWIYEIARNACIDQHRRSKRTEEVSYDADHALGSSDHVRLVTREPTPDAAVDTKQQLDHLCGAFGGLSQSHHKILVLRELEGMSYREIGERMSLSRPAVESTLFRARRRLTEEYEDLVSGRRCERVQAIIGSAAEGVLGTRDRRRLARHVSYCQPCRHYARRLGVEDVQPVRSLGARIAALLPIPAFLRNAKSAPVEAGRSWSSQASSTLSQWAVAASPAAEPVTAGWAKTAATVATMAALGMGAAVSSHSGIINVLTPGMPSHAASGGPARVPAAKSRPAISSASRPRVGSVLRAVAPGGKPVPTSSWARQGQRQGAVPQSSGGGASGQRRAEVSGGPAVGVPEVPARVQAQAQSPTDRGPELGTSSPAGVSVPASPPAGVTQPNVSVPDAPSAPSVPGAIPADPVAGANGTVGPLVGR